MTFYNYIQENIKNTVMISLSFEGGISFQYNYWNWFKQDDELHLLNNDNTIGHILHGGNVVCNTDGSLSYTGLYHPKQCLINFYFGGVNQS